MGCPLASLTTPSSTEFPAAALATKSITPTKAIPIDLINITILQRECGKQHKVQLSSFDKASLHRIRFCAGDWDANMIPLFLDNRQPDCRVIRETRRTGLCRVGNRF